MANCCDGGESVKIPGRKPMSQSEIIFGWDRFSTTIFAILVLAFGVWWVSYAILYEPGPDPPTPAEGGGHQGHPH